MCQTKLCTYCGNVLVLPIERNFIAKDTGQLYCDRNCYDEERAERSRCDQYELWDDTYMLTFGPLGR